ncbi:alpha/beta hydrolase [Comamonas sp.]|uniref:alpha/beta fold hydrolase n=1 Tax=Comamonas sp. TaxID=34028 RepID=UPI002898AE24|nr:alpha/beta hydrolase [Comamonas sp.]
MIEPTLNYVTCPGAALNGDAVHRMAYWEWNQTGNPWHPHVIVCVHGLTRQGRDFDVLAKALSTHARVICPDVVGRGYSDWLAEPMHYGVPQYTLDMVALLQQVHHAAPMQVLDWVGTSMGGLIGMSVAGNPALTLPVPVRKLLLNDVGPALEWPALQRIAAYVGKPAHFETLQQAADALQVLSAGFGPHTAQAWLELSRPMVRPAQGGGLRLHYDSAIAQPMQGMTQEQSARGAEVLWSLYDAIRAQTLLVRGAQSDLITQNTARAMQQRGPLAQWIDLEGVGHAPTFVADDQVAIARNFLLGDE